MANYRTVLLFNSLTLVLVGLVTACLSLFGSSVKGLFLPPCSATYPGAGSFFLAFQMLFYLSVMVCAFTFGLLRIIVISNKKETLLSAVGTDEFI